MINKIKKEDLENLIDVGITFKEIAKKYELSLITIRRLCSKYQLKSKSNELKRKKVKCLNCQKEIKTTLKEDKKFCNHSCSAIFNNKKRNKNNVIKKICLYCEVEISTKNTRQKYCSIKCHRSFLISDTIKNNIASSKTMKKYLINVYGEKCMKCNWCEVNEKSGRVPIELEHIDGNSDNNEIGNLLLLCPNCHSLTPTYKSLNKGKGRYKRMKRYKENKSF